jgi:hypothetical protein
MNEGSPIGANAIEIRIEDISQLFHSDPFPFRERDLDKDAEEFIVGWARELPMAFMGWHTAAHQIAASRNPPITITTSSRG